MLLPLVGATLVLVAALLWASAVPSIAGGPPSPPIWTAPTPNPMSHDDSVGVLLADMPVVIKDKDGKVLLTVTQQYFQQHLPEIEKQLNIYLGSGKQPPPYVPPTPIPGASPTPTPGGPPTRPIR